MEPGKITASAESERSWLPPLPSRATRRMWYGEPVMAMAELPAPQSVRVAICPPQARTGFATLAVKVIVICADLSPEKPVPSGYEYTLTPVIVPPNSVKTPATGVTPAPVTCGSAGMGNVLNVPRLHPATPRHGLALATVRSKLVR